MLQKYYRIKIKNNSKKNVNATEFLTLCQNYAVLRIYYLFPLPLFILPPLSENHERDGIWVFVRQFRKCSFVASFWRKNGRGLIIYQLFGRKAYEFDDADVDTFFLYLLVTTFHNDDDDDDDDFMTANILFWRAIKGVCCLFRYSFLK